MDDKQLLEKLVEDGLLKTARVEPLLEDARLARKRVEEVIYERRLVSEEGLVKVKSELLDIPYRKVDIKQITDDLLETLPEETVVNYKVIPLEKNKNMLLVGMIHPDDRQAQEALRFIAKQKKLSLGVYLITPSDYQLVVRRYSPYGGEVESALRSVRGKTSDDSGITPKVKLEQATANEDAPVIKIVSATLKEAVNLGASDIHIEPQRTRSRVRFRIDGDLREAQSLPLELHQAIVSRVKVLSDLKIDETRVPQDGRFRTEIFGNEIDFRVSTFPTPSGEKVALRVLDHRVGLKQLNELGLSGKSAEVIKEGISQPYGMVLITGPTGSGKTTTLYALVQKLNEEDVNIVTLEDPVEYTISGINQSQVRPEIGYTFASGLRQILRQDPDVMMVGEIRDTETADLSVHSALTGHIVLSTLHTNNAVGVVPRLIDMGVDAFLLPSVLNLMVSQRLVGRLCQDCKEQVSVSEKVAEIIKKEVGSIRPGPYKVCKSKGCKACGGKMFKGRVGLFEILKMTPQLADVINKQPTENKIQEEAERQGMVTLRQDGIIKALDGLVSIDEVLRETIEN